MLFGARQTKDSQRAELHTGTFHQLDIYGQQNAFLIPDFLFVKGENCKNHMYINVILGNRIWLLFQSKNFRVTPRKRYCSPTVPRYIHCLPSELLAVWLGGLIGHFPLG